jgi:hypothetical protein
LEHHRDFAQVEVAKTSLGVGQVKEGPAKLRMLYGVQKSVTDLVVAEQVLAQSAVGDLGSYSLVESDLDGYMERRG